MSNLVRSTRCRPSGDRSHRWITLMMIVAMFGFAGLVFADAGQHTGKKVAPFSEALESSTPEGDNHPLAPSAALAAPPANDTCAGAVPLQLNMFTYGTTVDANNDYQSPATAACFPGEGQFLSASTGRDVAYSFTAPADGKYTFRFIARSVSSAIYSQNVVLYLTDSCSAGGTVNCLKGGNSRYQQTGVGSKGQNSNLGQSVDCFPMTSGQSTFLIFDDGIPGRCSNNNHQCNDDSYCAAGATCVPQINVGGDFAVDVVECAEEVEPNDTPATASPLACGVTGASGAAPTATCWLGTRNGNACTRPYANVSYLDQVNPDSNMRCAGTGAMCVIDVTLGTDNCAAGTGPCQQQTDLDCDPRCDVGPNAGKSCSTHAFCNPVSDQGATCAGACIIDLHCVDNVTGVDTGIACTPTCQGSTIASVNGRVCASAANYDACPGAGVCTTTALPGAPGATCAAGQTCTRQFNEGDTDYYSVGSPEAGSKVFATVWGMNANDFDYRLRVTNDTNVLQWDDNDAVSFFGGAAGPTIGGAVTDGGPTYIGVSRTIPRTTNTYQIYSIVRPPLSAAQLEDESGPSGNNQYYYWPGDVLGANPVTAGGYLQGTMGFPGDTDCFKFLVNEGDLIDMYGDGNPSRAPGDPVGSVAQVSNPFPLFYDGNDAQISNFVFGTELKKNVAPNVPGPGLRALSPATTSDYVQWRASYTGMVEVCYYDLRNFYQTSGPQSYPTPWSGSLSVNCGGDVQSAGPGSTTTELSLTKTGPTGPVATGDIVEYVITVTNEGDEIAQAVTFYDALDPNLTFVSLNINDVLGSPGFVAVAGDPLAGDPQTSNTYCYLLPRQGSNDAPIYCINASMAPGTTTVYTLKAQVNNCIGGGIDISNTAEILASDSIDPDTSNNSGTVTFTTAAAPDNGCQDITCDLDLGECFYNLCTTNSFCDAGVCNNTEVADCDDESICTDDSCNTQTGCVNDSSQAGDLCDDFDDCTQNLCNPVSFCDYTTPSVAGTSCDDGQFCTNTSACNGAGSCIGGGGSPCEARECQDDLCNEDEDLCSYTPAAGGTVCDDENGCTGGDSCDGAGACAGTVPVICTPLDQCHVAGTCDSGTGSCSNPNAPDGTTCDDANAGTSGDNCQAGSCVGAPCTSTNNPKTKGWYKGLCQNAHSGDSLSDADAACVGALTTTFAGISTVADLCAVLMPSSPNNDSCGKAEDQLMTLALNICKQRVCPGNAIDSACGDNTTVDQSLDESDEIFANPARTTATCNVAECLDKEINNGHALELDSLLSTREAGSIRLSWLAPNVDDGQGQVNHYTIYRRAVGSKAPFVQIGTTTGLTFVDVNAASGSWEYDLVPNY